METARRVADDDEAQEKVALPGGILHPDGLEDGEGPAEAEADQHDTLENTHNFYSLTNKSC